MFKTIDGSLSTEGSIGELTVNILASVAQFELALIRERTLAGLKASKKKGGRPRGMTEEHAERAQDLLDGGATIDEVCEVFKVKRSALYKYLKQNRDLQAIRNGAATG